MNNMQQPPVDSQGDNNSSQQSDDKSLKFKKDVSSKKKKQTLIAGGILMAVMVAGFVSVSSLLNQEQDIRQQASGGVTGCNESCETSKHCLNDLMCYTTQDADKTKTNLATHIAAGWPGDACANKDVSSISVGRFLADQTTPRYTHTLTCDRGRTMYSRYLSEKNDGHVTYNEYSIFNNGLETKPYLPDGCGTIAAQTLYKMPNGRYRSVSWCSPEDNGELGTRGFYTTYGIADTPGASGNGYIDYGSGDGWNKDHGRPLNLDDIGLPDACIGITAYTSYGFTDKDGNNKFVESLWCATTGSNNKGVLGYYRNMPAKGSGYPNFDQASSWQTFPITDLKAAKSIPQACAGIDAMETFWMGDDLYGSWIWCKGGDGKYYNYKQYIPIQSNGWLDHDNSSGWNWWSTSGIKRFCRDSGEPSDATCGATPQEEQECEDAGGSWSVGQNKCLCPEKDGKDQVYNSHTKACVEFTTAMSKCEAVKGADWDFVNNTCDCPDGSFWRQQMCVSQNRKVCIDKGLVWENDTCQCGSGDWDAAADRCDCDSDASWNSDYKACLDSYEQACVDAGGTVDNPGENEPCNCGSGKVFYDGQCMSQKQVACLGIGADAGLFTLTRDPDSLGAWTEVGGNMACQCYNGSTWFWESGLKGCYCDDGTYWSEEENYCEPLTEQQLCEQDPRGTWVQMNTTCVDKCWMELDECIEQTTWGCKCESTGEDMCWEMSDVWDPNTGCKNGRIPAQEECEYQIKGIYDEGLCTCPVNETKYRGVCRTDQEIAAIEKCENSTSGKWTADGCTCTDDNYEVQNGACVLNSCEGDLVPYENECITKEERCDRKGKVWLEVEGEYKCWTQNRINCELGDVAGVWKEGASSWYCDCPEGYEANDNKACISTDLTTNIDFKFSFAGIPEIEPDINGNPVNIWHPVDAGQTLSTQLTFMNSDGEVVYTSNNFSLDYKIVDQPENSFYSASLALETDELPGGKYQIFVKGPMHRRHAFCKDGQTHDEQCAYYEFLNIEAGSELQLDFTQTPMDAGDLRIPSDDDKRNGRVDQSDYSFLYSCLSTATDPACVSRADINHSGAVTNVDRELLIKTLSTNQDDAS